MTRLFVRVLVAVVIFVGLAPAVSSQEDGEKPLGDVAREQRQAQDKKTHPSTVIHNSDIASPEEVGEAKGQPLPSPAPNTSASGNATADQKKTPDVKKKDVVSSSSIFDRQRSAEEEAADKFRTVPAGTRIPVDLLRNNVSEPVRLGFATPIPALSEAEVQFSADYYYVYDPDDDDPYGVPACSAQLTALTLGGVRYPVQTDAIPTACIKAGEITFTLTAPLKIPS